ncbi:MAG: Uma2 family endonuclease [Verrucomicrobiota bacterium]
MTAEPTFPIPDCWSASQPLTWEELCADPSLQDLPYRIELNEKGIVEMSPTSPRHQHFGRIIQKKLDELSGGGEVLLELSLDIGGGNETRVPDVTWAPKDWFRGRDLNHPYPEAPPLCVEVLSPANTKAEIGHKVALYLEHGAEEVWLCSWEGEMTFLNPEGAQERSRLFPGFPAKLVLDLGN